MSLIDQAAGKAAAPPKAGDQPVRKFISQDGELIRIADVVVQANMLPNDESQEYLGKGYRTALQSVDWPVLCLVGHVDRNIWANMLGRALEGLIHNVEHRQPDGRWRICEYELEVRQKASDDYLVLAIRLVDIVNAKPNEYKDGVPNLNVAVTTSLPPEIIQLLKQREAASRGEVASEMMEALKGFQETIREQQRLIEELRAERAAPAAPGKKGSAAPGKPPSDLPADKETPS